MRTTTNRSRIPAILAMVATGALALTACAGSGEGGASNPDTRLTVALPAQPPSLDPMVSTTAVTSEIAENVVETLLTVDDDLQVQPMLAESYDVGEDGKTYTFHLRHGVLFHDGSTFESSDVVASMERWTRLSGPGQNYFKGATWTAEDDLTVRLDLAEPSFGVLLALSNSREQIAAIFPSEIVKNATDKPIEDLVGTGPFSFVEWIPDQRLVLDRFDGYVPAPGAANGRAGNRTAQMASIDFVFVPDASTRILGLQTGEYDVVSEVPYDSAAQVVDDPSLSAGSFPSTLLNLYFNKAEGLFTSKEARHAAHEALDREQILTAAVSSPDFYDLTPSMMLAAQDGQWHTTVGEGLNNPVDPTGATSALKEAGYTGGTVRMIATRDYVESYNAAIVILEQLKAIGMNVSLETYDWPTFTQIRDDKSAWDLAVIPNVAKNDPGSLVFLREDFAGTTKDPVLDSLLAQYRSAATLEQAQGYYDELQRWFYDYLPVSKIGDVETIFASTPNVQVATTVDGIVWWSTTKTV